jgi:ClpP class serine protease
VYKPYVARLNITGDIDHTVAHSISNSLLKLNPHNLKAIALTVDSTGGSAAQAIIINERVIFLHQLKLWNL